MNAWNHGGRMMSWLWSALEDLHLSHCADDRPWSIRSLAKSWWWEDAAAAILCIYCRPCRSFAGLHIVFGQHRGKLISRWEEGTTTNPRITHRKIIVIASGHCDIALPIPTPSVTDILAYNSEYNSNSLHTPAMKAVVPPIRMTSTTAL